VGRLDNKVAIITGAARGQGAAEARLFAAEGAKVVLGDVLDEDGELVAKSIGASAEYQHHDVTDEAAWTALVAHTRETFGGVDILVNNAGILHNAPILDTTLDDYMRVVRVNQVGVFLGMKAVAPTMGERGGGSIVNISSIAGLRGAPSLVAYGASKFAVRGMTKTAALEFGPMGIRVNSIHPGIIDTPMLDDLKVSDPAIKEMMAARIPLREVAGPEQVARLALYLASDDSNHSSGAEFVVDGGITAAIGL